MLYPIILLLLAGIAQAIYITLSRSLIAGGLSGPACVFWQCVLGALLYGWLCIRQKNFPEFKGMDLFFHVVLALVYIVFPNLLIFLLSSQIAIGAITIVGCLSPICTYAIILLIGIERLNYQRTIGLILGFIGTMLLLAPTTDFGLQAHWSWSLVLLLLPLCFAISNVMRQQYWPAGASPTALIFAVMLTGSFILLPICIYNKLFFWPFEVPAPLSLNFFAYLTLTTIFIYIAFKIVQLAGAVFVSQIGYVVAVAGILIGYLLYEEIPNLPAVLSALLILSGLTLVTRCQTVK